MGDNSKIDPNTNRTGVPTKDAKTELTEEELAKVSGGITLTQACCGGKHFDDAKIVVR